MFGRRITLFRLFGFEIRIDASWLIIAALILWSLAGGLFPFWYRGLSPAAYWWMAAFGTLGLFGSIVFHELSHSLVARRYGLRIRGITLFIFGGIAEMEEEPPGAKAEFMMAAAGPLASIVLGFVFYAVGAVAGGWPVAAQGVFAYLAWINWILAGFNLVPAFPLDGGRMLRAALWHRKGNLRRATRIASAIGGGFGWMLMVLGVLQLFTGNFVGAVWWFLIGMFVRGASAASYQQVLVRVALEGEPVRRFMKPDPVAVRPDISVQDFVDDFVYRYHHKMFPVVSDSQRLIGCITTAEVKRVPRSEWDRHTINEILQPCSHRNTVGPDTDAAKVLPMMSKSGTGRLMVVENGRLLAVVSSRDVVNFLSTKLDLEGEPEPSLSAEAIGVAADVPLDDGAGQKTRTAGG
jgi:Zn-dependent protease/predicted transcriptional regulator